MRIKVKNVTFYGQQARDLHVGEEYEIKEEIFGMKIENPFKSKSHRDRGLAYLIICKNESLYVLYEDEVKVIR